MWETQVSLNKQISLLSLRKAWRYVCTLTADQHLANNETYFEITTTFNLIIWLRLILFLGDAVLEGLELSAQEKQTHYAALKSSPSSKY